MAWVLAITGCSVSGVKTQHVISDIKPVGDIQVYLAPLNKNRPYRITMYSSGPRVNDDAYREKVRNEITDRIDELYQYSFEYLGDEISRALDGKSSTEIRYHKDQGNKMYGRARMVVHIRVLGAKCAAMGCNVEYLYAAQYYDQKGKEGWRYGAKLTNGIMVKDHDKELLSKFSNSLVEEMKKGGIIF